VILAGSFAIFRTISAPESLAADIFGKETEADVEKNCSNFPAPGVSGCGRHNGHPGSKERDFAQSGDDAGARQAQHFPDPSAQAQAAPWVRQQELRQDLMRTSR
jgi:hypothetical protein